MTSGDIRRLQEPVIRYAASTIFVVCAIVVCTALGDIAASSWFGWLFGLVISGTIAAVLWGRELQEIQVRADRAANTGQGAGRLQVRDEEDDGPPATESPARFWGEPRPLRVDDDDD